MKVLTVETTCTHRKFIGSEASHVIEDKQVVRIAQRTLQKKQHASNQPHSSPQFFRCMFDFQS